MSAAIYAPVGSVPGEGWALKNRENSPQWTFDAIITMGTSALLLTGGN